MIILIAAVLVLGIFGYLVMFTNAFNKDVRLSMGSGNYFSKAPVTCREETRITGTPWIKDKGQVFDLIACRTSVMSALLSFLSCCHDGGTKLEKKDGGCTTACYNGYNSDIRSCDGNPVGFGEPPVWT